MARICDKNSLKENIPNSRQSRGTNLTTASKCQIWIEFAMVQNQTSIPVSLSPSEAMSSWSSPLSSLSGFIPRISSGLRGCPSPALPEMRGHRHSPRFSWNLTEPPLLPPPRVAPLPLPLPLPFCLLRSSRSFCVNFGHSFA